jgi:hypothetical protein
MADHEPAGAPRAVPAGGTTARASRKRETSALPVTTYQRWRGLVTGHDFSRAEKHTQKIVGFGVWVSTNRIR